MLNREEYFIGAEGQKRWLLTSKLPLADNKGQNIGLVGIGRDITEHSAAKFTHGICPECREKLDREARGEMKKRGGDVPS